MSYVDTHSRTHPRIPPQHSGCVRPGVSSITSLCVNEAPALTPPPVASQHAHTTRGEQAGLAAAAGGAHHGGAGAQAPVYSRMTELAQNLVSLSNVCVHASHISVFPPPGGGDFGEWGEGVARGVAADGAGGDAGGVGDVGDVDAARTLRFGSHRWFRV